MALSKVCWTAAFLEASSLADWSRWARRASSSAILSCIASNLLNISAISSSVGRRIPMYLLKMVATKPRLRREFPPIRSLTVVNLRTSSSSARSYKNTFFFNFGYDKTNKKRRTRRALSLASASLRARISFTWDCSTCLGATWPRRTVRASPSLSDSLKLTTFLVLPARRRW